ncbi:Cell division control protein Cdc4 [Rasamsonia emersonii CBS 393.64]|uniref:Probable E3 ubiquitin ligase complex SCF subunit sconB n=1 Tax=Rasamsonia emersonii (strain ATCC 16479 / CBS 393.64 / IMI 116815) TaxID=1408163 RepID=A0A0F4YY80_RASE3|nr:Cell division control protein Cdc4 [Rasamsonia emersonii CBS 393.64]KKA23065.1 Cell division control protein Cdc4 [Rasamsonia emersonii CBS 393.64]
MAELGSRSRVRDASPLPSGTVESPAYPSLATGFKHTRKRDLDGIREARAGTAASSTTLGQFSFAPATRTTVVTTTTTTTTNFPPLVLNAPRSTRELDPKLYPLAAAPTPTSLRHFKFELGGKSIVFNEPEDTAGALQELKEQHEALKASNGVLRSVTVYDSPKQPTSSHRLSRQPASHPSSLKRRPVSPVSISESAKNGRRTRSLAVPSEPGSLQNQEQPQRDQAVSAAHPSVMGLATPKTETSRLQLGESSVLRRRIHNGRLGRKENSGSPVPEGVDSRDVTRTSYPKQPLPKDGSRASPLGSERTPVSERRVLSNQESQDSQSSLEDEDGVGEAAGSGQETIDEPSAEHQPQRTASAASSLAAIDSAIAQDMCLPSPSLSPVTAMNTHNADSFFDLTEDQGTDTDSSFENQISNQQTTISLRGEQAGSSSSSTTERSYNEVKTSSASLMDIPVILDFFDSVPGAMKNYLMYQLLKRCPKPTLQFIADVVNPALKCDFLAQLPLELSLNIVKYFDFRTMCRAAQVSKKWRHIVNSDEKTWKELFDRDGFTLPEGELQRAIREGWGWQFPNGKDDYEKDLSASIVRTDSDAPVVEPSPATASADGNMATSSFTRRPKRKAATRVSSRKLAKRKISSAGGETSDSVDWTKEIASLEGPYAAANAAAAAVPYPDVGLPSLRSLHLYKSLYQRHYSIRQSWMRRDIKPKHIAFRAHDRHVVTCLQFDTDKILTGSDDQKIHVYDTKTGALKSVLRGHEGGVWALEYHGNTLVSGSTDRTVRVWDIEKAKCTQVFHGHTSTVRCLQILLPAEVGKNADGTPEMMPKEPLIITGSRDSTLRVWRLPKPGDPTYGLDDGPHGDGTDCPYFIRVLSGHQHSVRAIAAHGDTLGHTLKVYSVVLDHARNRCISGSMDNMVKVWSLENGSLLYNLEGHTSLVGLLDLKNDRLVSAAADSTLRIWDPETGQCKSTLSAHTGAITCFQHDGQKVISGSDRTLKMWDVRTGECVKDLLTNLSGVWQVRFNDRRCVAAVQRDGLTYIEVLDFGAYRDGVPEHRLGKRILVDHRGCEASEEADDDVLDYEIVNG